MPSMGKRGPAGGPRGAPGRLAGLRSSLNSSGSTHAGPQATDRQRDTPDRPAEAADTRAGTSYGASSLAKPAAGFDVDLGLGPVDFSDILTPPGSMGVAPFSAAQLEEEMQLLTPQTQGLDAFFQSPFESTGPEQPVRARRGSLETPVATQAQAPQASGQISDVHDALGSKPAGRVHKDTSPESQPESHSQQHSQPQQARPQQVQQKQTQSQQVQQHQVQPNQAQSHQTQPYQTQSHQVQPQQAPPLAKQAQAQSQPAQPQPAELQPAEPQLLPTDLSPLAQPAAPVMNRRERREAPPGCTYVVPEDIPRLRAAERKRRLDFEKELVAEMRELYAAQERDRLVEESVAPEEAEAESQQLALRATFSQLKQSVGSLVRQRREKQQRTELGDKQLIDVEQFTMGALCKDLPVGDRNESFDDYELARINRRRDTVRVFRAKMWSRSKYVPREEERAALQEAYRKYQGERQARTGKIKAEQDARFSELDERAQEGALPQASIEIQADGSISLVGTQYDRHRNNMSNLELGAKSKTEVDPTEQVINSHSFATKERPDRWSKEETDKFYEALSAWGTDFNLISHLFPLRSRNQIKTKFKYEEKRNAVKVQMHLLSRRKVNVDSYARVSDVKIEEIGTIESEIENVRREHADQMRLGEASKAEAKAEDLRVTEQLK